MKNLINIFFIVFSMLGYAQSFEHTKVFEEALAETDKYNMSSIVEGDPYYYCVYRTGPDYFSSNRFQFAKLDISGNTVFHKEILAPDGMEFNLGYNHATPPPIAYGQNRISVIIPAYLQAPPYTHIFYQFVFDTDGTIIKQNSFDSPIFQEFSNIKATTDGFVFISSEASINDPEYPASLHIFKSDFEGNVLWQRQYQFTEDFQNTMYAKDLAIDDSGNLYISIFHAPSDIDEQTAMALFKFDNEGSFIFLKRYIDESQFTGIIRNISMAFDNYNGAEDLYIMSSWSSVVNTKRTNFYKVDTDGTLLASKQLFGAEFGSKLVSSKNENACTVLLGKSVNDGISNSFENSGDPVLINLNTDLSVNWAYAYGGDDEHYTDDLLVNKDDSYLILARDENGEYLINTDQNGASLCESIVPNIAIEDLTITVVDKDAYELSLSMSFSSNTSVEVIDVPFYTPEEKCCPGGIPEVSFAYNVSSANHIISFTNTSTNGDDYNWDFDDGTFSNSSNITHEFGSNGVYEVCLTAENECGTAFYCEEIIIQGLGNEVFFADKIKIQSDQNGIKVLAAQGTDISLYNTLGQLIFAAQNIGQELNINKPIPGIYHCKITYENKLVSSEKIIVM